MTGLKYMKIYWREDSVWLFTFSMEFSLIGIFGADDAVFLVIVSIVENLL